MVRGRPGSTPRTDKGEWFARLIAQGVSDSYACRIVGVNRKTGSDSELCDFVADLLNLPDGRHTAEASRDALIVGRIPVIVLTTLSADVTGRPIGLILSRIATSSASE
jgi:hypothetical protein